MASSQVRNDGLAAEALQLLVDGNERLLRHIVGVLGRAERGKGGAVDRAAVALDELAEGLVVAGLRAANQGQIHGRGSGLATTARSTW